MSALFVQASQNRIYQDIVEQVQSAIFDGSMRPGEKLPPERELVEVFKTSRPTLREALRTLEQKGLIEIRLGVKGGAYVRTPNSELMAENLGMLIKTQSVSLSQLAEFREGIEGIVAGLAAERATSTDIANLKKLLAEAKQHYDRNVKGWADLVKVDEKLHLEIAKIAGNPLYSFVLHSIHLNIHRYFSKYLEPGKTQLEENYQDLVQMVSAIEEHNSESATRVVRDHVSRFNKYMQNSVR